MATKIVNMTEEAAWHWAEGTKYAIEAAKSILLVNGAAAVAMLTFIGNLKLQPTRALIISMVLFAIAAMVSAMLFFFAYVTQLCYGKDDVIWATRWHIATYLLMGLSVVLFMVGMGYAASGFLSLPHANFPVTKC